jgi:hypothetical protein
MRIWRALKGLGCVALRDGAYLLPAGTDREQSLRDLADECSREGGVAWLLAVQSRSDEEALASTSGVNPFRRPADSKP